MNGVFTSRGHHCSLCGLGHKTKNCTDKAKRLGLILELGDGAYTPSFQECVKVIEMRANILKEMLAYMSGVPHTKKRHRLK